MDRFERLVESISRLGTSLFAIRQRGKRPITRDPEFVVLSMLLAETIPISEIGRRLHRSKPCMTALIGRLIREGKVRKIPSTEDRRVTRIAITENGRREARAKQRELSERIRAYFSPLSDDEIGRVEACLSELNGIISRIRTE